jgi:NitT/TauT family transport system substrate-binding protein
MDRSPRPDVARRAFLAGTCALGTTSLLGLQHGSAGAEPAPETRKIRFVHNPSICSAPQYLAEEFLRLDGFTDVEYLPLGARNGPRALAEGRADITMWDAPGLIPHLDAGQPIVLLAGVHTGCYELFGNERVHALRDLKGKTVAMGLFVDGKADAFLGFGQQPPELRAQKVGHVLVNTGQDRPWSDYFCCMVAANRQFAERHPIATKRVLRAILRATDICASEPQRAARYLADKLYEPRFQLGLEVMKSLPYNRWREGNAEDTLRFHALRLHQVGMIKTNPSKLIAQSTNWRFLNELRKELKG